MTLTSSMRTRAPTMLPPFIIDQIRKREEDERKEQERPVLELPLHRPPRRKPLERRGDEEEADRGVIIIDLTGG